ncbi:MAG: outer membrane beta-barrel protein [Bacteroidota bacterium]
MKRLFYSLVLLFLATIVSAQSADVPQVSRFSFGASLEAGYSGVKDYIADDNSGPFGRSVYGTTEERRPSYALGLWGTYWLSPRWDIELGINFGTWRAFAEAESESYNPLGIMTFYGLERYWLDQDLLRIPLQMRLHLGQPTNRIRPFIALGTQAAYITQQTNHGRRFYGGTGSEPTEYAFTSTANLNADWVDIRRWQWSLLGGIGIQMDRISLSIQRNFPLTNTYQDDYRLYRYYPDMCSGDFIGNTPGDSFLFCDYRVNQLRQTSLRFEYRIF